MWEVQKMSELVMKFRKIKSPSSQDNPSALSETSKPSDLSDFIKFRSEIAELQKNLEDLLIRVWKLQGSQGNLPGSYITDLISMMRDLICLDIKTASPPTFLRFEVATVPPGRPSDELKQQEVRNLPAVIIRSEACDTVEGMIDLIEITSPLPDARLENSPAEPVTRD